jgi:hypothetical protein
MHGDLGSETLRWRDRDGRDWLVQVQLAIVDGRAECVGLDLRSYRQDGVRLERFTHDDFPEKGEAAGVVTASLLRAFPVGRLIAEAKQTARILAEQDAEPPPVPDELRELERRAGVEGGADYWRAFRAIQAHERLPALRGGRPPIYDLEEVAKVYLRGGATPTRAVAEHFHISRSAAAKQVARARETGFLDKTTQGKTSGRRMADSPIKEDE